MAKEVARATHLAEAETARGRSSSQKAVLIQQYQQSSNPEELSQWKEMRRVAVEKRVHSLKVMEPYEILQQQGAASVLIIRASNAYISPACSTRAKRDTAESGEAIDPATWGVRGLSVLVSGRHVIAGATVSALWHAGPLRTSFDELADFKSLLLLDVSTCTL